MLIAEPSSPSSSSSSACLRRVRLAIRSNSVPPPDGAAPPAGAPRLCSSLASRLAPLRAEKEGRGDNAAAVTNDDDDGRAAAGRVWTGAAKELLETVGDGRRRSRALGLANAGLADVEGLLSLAAGETSSARSPPPPPPTAAPSPPPSPPPRPAALAVELHPLLPQRKLVGVCRRKGVAMIALNPAGGDGREGAGAGCCSNTKALLESSAVVAAAAAENKSPREVRFSLYFELVSFFIYLMGGRIARASGEEEEEEAESATNERATPELPQPKQNKKWGVKKHIF